MEYQKCQKRFKVSTNKLIESNLNAAKASFLPDDEKEDLVKSLEKQYALISFDSFWIHLLKTWFNYILAYWISRLIKIAYCIDIYKTKRRRIS